MDFRPADAKEAINLVALAFAYPEEFEKLSVTAMKVTDVVAHVHDLDMAIPPLEDLHEFLSTCDLPTDVMVDVINFVAHALLEAMVMRVSGNVFVTSSYAGPLREDCEGFLNDFKDWCDENDDASDDEKIHVMLHAFGNVLLVPTTSDVKLDVVGAIFYEVAGLYEDEKEE